MSIINDWRNSRVSAAMPAVILLEPKRRRATGATGGPGSAVSARNAIAAMPYSGSPWRWRLVILVRLRQRAPIAAFGMSPAMSVDSVQINPPSSCSVRVAAAVVLLLIIACFALPLAAAWLLVDRWRPAGSVQHGELLNPAPPGFAVRSGGEKSRRQCDGAGPLGAGLSRFGRGQCDSRCQTACTTCAKSAWR
jgi:hypothetical protein